MKERDIFTGALEISDPVARDAYVKGACGHDTALYERVCNLIKEHEADDSLIAGAPIDNLITLDDPSAPMEELGSKIGFYKLLQKIGEGGMGIVYMAEQEKPIQRKVALKIIKLGMDTKQVVARFEAERQALAMMDHPNIAKVLDAGATDQGRPYFVMELVKGVPITEFCDRNQFSTRERLELFTKVCHAIQSAHQKGIIHRDIKPTNILVSLTEGAPHPMVIDFGIAKATNQRLTEKTLFTNYAQMVGTPAYMSPEQAEMSQLDIDTRSDIYSLGVLLYELLTGEPPFTADNLCSQGYGEMQRIIAEEEPPRPSLRLSSFGAKMQEIVAKNRSLSLPNLTKQLQGDLDWIILKALEKNRSRRYETATGLANDIQRHLNDEPVTAAKPSLVYQFGKFYRRKKSVAISGLTVAAALLITMIVTLFQTHRAQTEIYNAIVNEADLEQEAKRPGYRQHTFDLIKKAIELKPDDNKNRLREIALKALEDPYVGSIEETTYEPENPDTIHITRFIDNLFAVGHKDGKIRIYDADTGVKRFDFQNLHAQPIVSIERIPSTGQWATADASGRVLIWTKTESDSIITFESKEIRSDNPSEWTYLVASKDTLIIGIPGQEVIDIWRTGSADKVQSLRLANPIQQYPKKFDSEDDLSERFINLSPDGVHLALASIRPIEESRELSAKVIIHHIETGEEIVRHGVEYLARQPIHLKFSKNGNYLVVKTDQEISVFETLQWLRVQSTMNDVGFFGAPEISENSEDIVYTSRSGDTIIWNLKLNKILRRIPYLADFYRFDSEKSLIGYKSLKPHSWSCRYEHLSSSNVVKALSCPDQNRYGLIFSHHNRWLATTGYFGVRVWDLLTDQEITLEATENGNQRKAESPTFSFNDELFAAQIGYQVFVWETKNWKIVNREKRNTRCRFHPSKNLLLSINSDKGAKGLSIRKYELIDGQLNVEAFPIIKTKNSPRMAEFNVTGDLIAWTSTPQGSDSLREGTLHVADFSEKGISEFFTLDNVWGWYTFSFAENSNRMLMNPYKQGKGPELWDIRKNKKLPFDLPGLDVRLSASRFKLMTRITHWHCISDPTGIRLLDPQTTEEIIRFPNTLSTDISQVALSPSHRHLAYVLRNGDIRIWDLEATGQAIKSLGLEWFE